MITQINVLTIYIQIFSSVESIQKHLISVVVSKLFLYQYQVWLDLVWSNIFFLIFSPLFVLAPGFQGWRF